MFSHAKQVDLFQQTVGHSSPKQARGGWLVRDSGQEDVQVVLKEGKVPRVLVSEVAWQKVEDPCTVDTQGSLPSLLHLGRGSGGNGVGDGHPTPHVTSLPAYGVPIYQALADLP